MILDSAIELTAAERGYLVRVLGEKPSGGYRLIWVWLLLNDLPAP